ncbi:MAG: SapC family protein [Wenzhouxiangella sp.]
MAKHVLLDNVSHKDLKVRTGYRPGCGYDANVVRIFPSEFCEAQREYPLFFIKDAASGHFEPVALLGFSGDENLYLGAGGWDASYVPLAVQRQPFLIGFQTQQVDGIPTQVPVIHVDLDHPSISKTDGEPVFLRHGGLSPYLERIESILGTIHHGHEASRALSQVLVGLELIESVKLEIRFDDVTSVNLEGLYKINEDTLRNLSADALETLHRQGYLRDLYLMLASLQNMPHLIERKTRRQAS